MEFAANIEFLRGLPAELIGSRVSEMGFDGIELPVMPDFPCEASSVSRELVPLVRRLKNDYSIGVPIVSHDCSAGSREAAALYDACAEAGVRFVQPQPYEIERGDWWISFSFAVEQMREFDRLSEKAGVTTLLPLHFGDSLFTTCLSGWAIAKECDPDFVSIRVDPAYLVASGESYEVGLNIIKGYLGVIGVANCIFSKMDPDNESRNHPRFAFGTIADGEVSWQRVFEFLRSIEYDDILCFESLYDDHRKTEELLASDLRWLQGIEKNGG